MKRFTLIDNSTKKVSRYSEFQWNVAWFVVFIIGVSVGYLM